MPFFAARSISRKADDCFCHLGFSPGFGCTPFGSRCFFFYTMSFWSLSTMRCLALLNAFRFVINTFLHMLTCFSKDSGANRRWQLPHSSSPSFFAGPSRCSLVKQLRRVSLHRSVFERHLSLHSLYASHARVLSLWQLDRRLRRSDPSTCCATRRGHLCARWSGSSRGA